MIIYILEYVSEREREREREDVCVHMRVCVCVCVFVCVCVCVCVCVTKKSGLEVVRFFGPRPIYFFPNSVLFSLFSQLMPKNLRGKKALKRTKNKSDRLSF